MRLFEVGYWFNRFYLIISYSTKRMVLDLCKTEVKLNLKVAAILQVTVFPKIIDILDNWDRCNDLTYFPNTDVKHRQTSILLLRISCKKTSTTLLIQPENQTRDIWNGSRIYQRLMLQMFLYWDISNDQKKIYLKCVHSMSISSIALPKYRIVYI